MGAPICDAPCRYGGVSATRKHSNADLGHMWHCNRKVKNPGQRCWQHAGTPESETNR